MTGEIPIPDRVDRLPRHRGFPVPWFVAEIDGQYDFRVIRPGGVQLALQLRCCWVCGQPWDLDELAYVAGPMCALNRTSAEPPNHRDCATYAARACPFLSRPHARRREKGLPGNAGEAPGIAIKRNPGVALVWITKPPVQLFPDGKGGVLFNIGDPVETLWFAGGREATREEVQASIDTGLPLLREHCDSPEAHSELTDRVDAVEPLLPVPA